MFVYCVYPWCLYPRPNWINALIPLLPQGVGYYDPNISIKQQIGRLGDIRECNLPPDLIGDFNLPKEILLSPTEDLLKWESPLLHEQIWRDLYFLVRASVVFVDGNLMNLNDGAVELSIAHRLKKPIILLSDRVVISSQLRYLANFTITSGSPDLPLLLASLFKTPSSQNSPVQIT